MPFGFRLALPPKMEGAQPVWGVTGTNVTLSNSNRRATTGASTASARTSAAVSSGLWYVEFTLGRGAGWIPRFGICTSAYSINSEPGTANTSWVIDGIGRKITNGTDQSYGTGAINDNTAIGMLAYNANTGAIWWGVNGSWFAGGNPATGSNPAYTGLSGDRHLVMGTTSAFPSSWLEHRLFADYDYSPPAGFLKGWGF